MMKAEQGLPRRRFLHLAAGAVALPSVSRIAHAQTYPARPITMVVPLAPGGSTDVIGRIMAEAMRGPLWPAGYRREHRWSGRHHRRRSRRPRVA